jgi:pyridoxal phosphate enzyme (YggS family)
MPSPTIAANLERLRNQIADACARAHRDPASVALMAVSKTHPADAILEAYAANQRLFGENRVQEWESKWESSTELKRLCGPFAESLSTIAAPPSAEDLITMHLIGPLQNNKTTKAAELFHGVDSLDSLKTAQRLNTTCLALGKTLPVLIEIKLSPEDSKHGLDISDPSALPSLLAALAPLTALVPAGLMTVPPLDPHPPTPRPNIQQIPPPPDPASARPYFQHLRRLRDENLPACPTLTQLSMGMSNDFLVAIEEGSTCVRLGTAIFGHREYPA